jgi:hypothetical protein
MPSHACGGLDDLVVLAVALVVGLGVIVLEQRQENGKNGKGGPQ